MTKPLITEAAICLAEDFLVDHPSFARFVVRAEIEAGTLIAHQIDGPTGDDDAFVPISFFGQVRVQEDTYVTRFCLQRIGAVMDEETLAAAHRALDRLSDGATPDGQAFENLAASPKPRTIAVVEIRENPSGHRKTFLYHHPVLTFDQALAVLKESAVILEETLAGAEPEKEAPADPDDKPN